MYHSGDIVLNLLKLEGHLFGNFIEVSTTGVKIRYQLPRRLSITLRKRENGLKSKIVIQGLSRYLETGCPNRGFIDFCVSKVWYKIHTTNKIDPIPLQILLF